MYSVSSLPCPQCSTPQPADARACMHCGASLNASSPASERRQVTVVFADLVGFTMLSEQLDAERVHFLVNACFDTLVPVIEQFDGTVDKFMGDAVMALWGAPVAHEDDPVRAIHAARAMIAALEGFNQQHQTNFALHIGISTGVVIAGNIGSVGRASYSVIGDSVNLAARLQDQAQAGEILVGPETQRMTAHVFEFTMLEPLRVKGKSELIQAYLVGELRSVPQSGRGIRGLSSPMVGREQPLNALIEATQNSIDGSGCLAVVVGEAGIGKSRLLTEWRNAVQTDHPRVRWAEGRSLSYSIDVAYYLLRDLVRSLLDFGSLNDDETASSLHAVCVAHDFDPETESALKQLLLLDNGESDQNPQSLQAQYLIAVRSIVLAVARQTPLICVLEDMHWADSTSIDVLLRLLPMIHDVPLLFVATLRPDRESQGWRLVQRAQEIGDAALELQLEALSPANSRELIGNLLQFDSLPEQIRTLILTKADGNPFFLEEVIRSLIDRGAIEQRNDIWIATDAITEIELPDTVHGLLAARIDRLPLEQRDVLRVAAVVGRRFAIRVVSDVLGQSKADFDRNLTALLDAELLRRDKTKANAFMRFRHALVHEVVYNTTLNEERRRLHLDVGRVLERQYASRLEELAPTLAQHFSIANDPDALKYWLMAGDIAYRQYAVAEAVTYYERAAEYMQANDVAWDATTSPHFYLNFGRVLELHGQQKRALALYEQMETLTRAADDLPNLVIALTERSRVYALPSVLYSQLHAQDYALRALELAQTLNLPHQQARIYWVLALNSGMSGNFDLANTYGSQALRLARELNIRELLAHCLHDFHRGALNSGQLETAKSMLYEAIGMWRELGNLPMLADGLASAADIAQGEYQYEQAIAMAQESERISLTIGNTWNLSFARLVLGEIAMVLGHVTDAVAFLHSSVALSSVAGPVGLTFQGYANLYNLYIIINDLESAERVMIECRGFIERMEPSSETLSWLARIWSALSLCAVERGDWHTAEQHLERATQIEAVIMSDNAVAAVAMISRVRAVIARIKRQWDEVLPHLKAYIGDFEAIYRTLPWVRMLNYEMRCAVLAGQNQWDELKTLALEALKDTEEVRDQHWKWRLALFLARAYYNTGERGQAAHYYAIARASLDYILEHTASDALREHLLALPLVRAVFTGDALTFAG